MSDAAFLAGIAADPADRVRRLVYADYLDDHADPRGELVRVEEAMRDLPAFTGEFWHLKARRNELRPLAPADWLTAMRYGVDAHPVFHHGVPDDPRGRWRLIREFLERWHGVTMPDSGDRAAEVAAAEARLGVTLGAGVWEFIALTADYRAVSGRDAFLRDWVTVERVPGHSAVSLILQGEGDHHWAVRNGDLAADDPPVYGFVLEDEERGRFALNRGGAWTDRLTSWVLDYTLVYSRGNWGVTVYPWNGAAFRAALTRLFPPGADVLGTEVYELDGVMVAVGRGLHGKLVMNLNAAYRVPAGFREFADPAFRVLTVSAAPPQSRAAVEWAWTLAGDRCGGHCTHPGPHAAGDVPF